MVYINWKHFYHFLWNYSYDVYITSFSSIEAEYKYLGVEDYQ